MDQSSPLNLDHNIYSDQTLFTNVPQPTFINVEYYFNKIYVFFRDISGSGSGRNSVGYDDALGYGSRGVEEGINSGFFVDILQFFLYLILIFSMTVIAYIIVRMIELRKKEDEYMQQEIASYAKRREEEKQRKEIGGGGGGKIKNPRWEKILEHLYSERSADWKLAIIDADEMLFGLMTDLGFKGESFGDKLKSADRDKFHSLSAAWEVHTIRNRIAHEGIAYELSQREAKRVIALYEQIFHEFGYL